ncbi:PKD domain-containing protein [Porphyromonadaceae sp. NP-X]|nr:PKD domain-containing protein [Porphyromonadaceae sp. NP-X]
MKKYLHLFLILSEMIFFSFHSFAACQYSEPPGNFLYRKNTFSLNRVTNDNSLSATITANKPGACINTTSPIITFTGANGTPPYTFSYKINNGYLQTITSVSGNSAILNVPTNATGTFKYTLISVSDAVPITQNISNQEVTITIGQPPTVDFTFSNENCAGENITFTPINLPAGADYSFNWEFGDNTTSTDSVAHHIFMTAIGNGTQTFTVKLTVTDNLTACTNSKEKTITLSQHPDPKLNVSVESDTLAGQVTFISCSNVATEFVFTNPNENNPSIVSYIIDWGDGSSLFTGSTWSMLKHTYNLGMTTLKYTVQGQNGCSVTKEYKIFVGSNPAGGILSPGNTDICVNEQLTFPIANIQNNPPGTIYTISFNDGTPSEVFYDNTRTEITHTFTNGSCGTYSYDGRNYYSNSFMVSMTATNPCSPSGTSSAVTPIYVSIPPEANFNANNFTCVNTDFSIQNTSRRGYVASSSGCTSGDKFVWSISPNEGVTVVSGSLGDTRGLTDEQYNSWISGSDNVILRFANPGNYTIKIKIANRCGASDTTQTICVEPVVAPTFTLDNNKGCAPFTVKVNNTTDTTQLCNRPSYNWSISYQPANCGNASSYTYVDGTSSSSKNPHITFNNPGIYTLRLFVYSNCSVQTYSQEVTVTQPPIVSINDIPDYCGSAEINPTADIQTCIPTTDSVTYEWSFPGGTPATSTAMTPGKITYSSPGTYIVSLTVKNDCGNTTTTKTFKVNVVPQITNTELSQTICSGDQSQPVLLTSTVQGTNFSWTAQATTGVTGFTSSGTGDTIPAQNIFTTADVTGTVTYYITPKIGTCTGDTVRYVINVYPRPYFTKQPVSSVLCKDGEAEPLTVSFSKGEGSYSIQWYSNSIKSISGGDSIPGAVDSVYIPLTSTIGTTYYYCVIKFSSGYCRNIISDIATVTVNPFPEITQQPLIPQKVCIGGSLPQPLKVKYSGGAGPSYQWYSNNVDSNIGGTAISGANDSIFMPPVFTSTGTFFYYVMITFSGSNCNLVTSETAKVEVIPDPSIAQQPLASQTICQNSTAENLSVKVTGGIGNYAFQWFQNTTNSNTGGTKILNATDSIFIPSTATTGTLYYYCEITQPNGPGCNAVSNTSQVIVREGPSIIKQPSSFVVCKNETSPKLFVSWKNGVGIPSYQWFSNTSNSNTGGTLIPAATDSVFFPSTTEVGTMYYYCAISFSSGGCSELISNPAAVTVNQFPVISDLIVSVCSGESFNAIPENSVGNIVPLGTTYTWSEPIVSPVGSITGASSQSMPQTEISQTLTNITTSTAIVTYTVKPSAKDCDGTEFKISVTVYPAAHIEANVHNITCNGANDGMIQLTITGGVPFATGDPYQITWSGPNGFTSHNAIISNLSAGNYQVQVLDAGGCPYQATYSIIEPEKIKISEKYQKNVSCYGNADGEISFNVSGGTGNYVYSWTKNGIPFSGNNHLSSLQAGTYAVSVTDSNSCAPQLAEFTIIEPLPLIISLSNKKDVLCYGDATGSIEVEVTGGTKAEITSGNYDYYYSWSGPENFSSNNKNLSNLKAGDYFLTVRDSSNCTVTSDAITITQPQELIVLATSTAITCFGDDNASITLNVSGGVEPYSVQWSNYGEGMVQENLSPGTYDITVADKNGCQKSLQVTIPEPFRFSVKPVVKQISCYGANDGSIKLNFVGGLQPVSFAWDDDPNAGVDRNQLKPGVYTVRIHDAQPCDIIRSFTIIEPQPLSVLAQVKDATDCQNVNSGSILLAVTGGRPPYKYEWSNGMITKDIENIQAGNYSVQITDSSGCNLMEQYTVHRQAPLKVSVTSHIEFDCSTKNTIQVNQASVSGGIPPYQISWSSGTISGANNEIMTTGQSGLAFVHITDALQCELTASVNIQIPEQGIGYQLLDCNQRSYQFNALLPIEKPDYTYSWDFGDGGISNIKNPQYNFSKPGNYKVTLKVQNDECSLTYETTISVEAPPVLSLDKEPIFCIGDSLLLHVSGADYYRWNDGSTADNLLIVKPGTYSVEGTSKAGCSSILTFVASYFDLFHYTIQTDQEMVTDRQPTIEFWSEETSNSMYSWDFGDGDKTQGNHISHTYAITRDGYYEVTLTVINPNGCREYATKRIWIGEPTLPNTITPNGDGKNDSLLKGFHIQVFNRNGLLLFDGREGWDGTYKGKPVTGGTYFYVLMYATPEGLKSASNFVTVIR